MKRDFEDHLQTEMEIQVWSFSETIRMFWLKRNTNVALRFKL